MQCPQQAPRVFAEFAIQMHLQSTYSLLALSHPEKIFAQLAILWQLHILAAMLADAEPLQPSLGL